MSYTINQLQEAMAKNHSTRQEFLKFILSLSSAMLAILAAFHTTQIGNSYNHIVYLIGLATLLLGTLSGGIVLYFDTVAAKSMFLQVKRELQEQLRDASYSASIASYNPPKLFYICEKLCYISLVVAVISVSLYAGLCA